MTDTSNYGALSEGVRLYVAAIRSFIGRTLRERGDGSDEWFDEYVLRTLPKYLRNPLQSRLDDHQSRPEQLLDTPHFRYVINGNWRDTYEAIFRDKVVLHWIGEIAYWRNVWAHFDDDAAINAERILDTCRRVLQEFDSDAAEQVESLKLSLSSDVGEPTEAVTDDDTATASSESEKGADAHGAKWSWFQVRQASLAKTQREAYLADDKLRELVRDFWQHRRLLDVGDEGLLDPDEAGEIYAEMSERIVVDLLRAMIERSGGWDSESGENYATYNYDALGMAVDVQITFPEWALPDDAR